jgi:hypothetical protein
LNAACRPARHRLSEYRVDCSVMNVHVTVD